MGIISRLSTLIKAKMSQLLERAEDPRMVLDYSYEKQLELVQNVKRGIVEVTTSKRRLELQAARLDENVAKLDRQAREAVAAGREDLGRLALQRKQSALMERQGLETQIAELQREQNKLMNTEARLQAKIEAFRTRKEVIKAQYSAAEAQVKVSESLTGISEEMTDVGMTVQRAEDKTEKMRARAGAIDELIAAGTLDEVTGGRDEIERELEHVAISKGVEDELATLKRQLGAPELKQLKEGKEE